jgi:dUTP pyrophosphatase
LAHTVKLKKLEHFDNQFEIPAYETELAAGADIRACLPEGSTGKTLTIEPGQRTLVPTGLAMEIPAGFEIQIRPRSGMSLKTDLLVVNSPGTIDADYRGEVKIILGNFGNEPAVIEHGQRIAQMVLAPITQAKFEWTEELSSTDRGAGGFGSTGTK